ncbi:MAG: HAD family phosphatase [Candidatus Aminicenantes bacterium]|nr:HAD family phosphatase [Candidatus Aminicenantes bacterium]
MVKALIFDMDGLMIDSERLYWEVERGIARQFGKEVGEETLWKMMGRRPIEGMRIFVQDLGLPLTAERATEIRDGLMREKYRNESEPMPGLIHILDAFHGRLKMAVCTGAQGEFMEIVVDRLKIRDRFDVLQSSDGIKNGKPNPEIYLAACAKLGVAPRQSIVLEDSANGCLAAKRAGCYTIAVPSDYSRGQDFGCADFIAADLFAAERHISSLLS